MAEPTVVCQWDRGAPHWRIDKRRWATGGAAFRPQPGFSPAHVSLQVPRVEIRRQEAAAHAHSR